MTESPDAVFCDYNAGFPVDPRVLERFVDVERACPGNPSSVHAAGRRSRAALEEARDHIASALGVVADDIVFTSGGTEAANLAVRGLGDPGLPVLLGPTEHPAVLAPAEERGTVRWSVDAVGRVLVTPPDRPVGLVALVHAQSELGTLQPVAAAGALADNMGVPFVVDAAQSLGREPLDRVLATATAIVLSPHKCGGLRGHGVLLVRDRTLRPLLLGGHQERGLRAGTASPSLAAANALAIDLAVREQSERRRRMLAARDAFVRGLAETGVAHRVLTPLDDSLANTTMVAFARVDGRSLLPMLDLSGVRASHGTACSSGSPTPPLVLRSAGFEDAEARASIRFSFGHDQPPPVLHDAGLRVGRRIAKQQKKM